MKIYDMDTAQTNSEIIQKIKIKEKDGWEVKQVFERDSLTVIIIYEKEAEK